MTRQRIGVICIPPRIAAPSAMAFDDLYEAIGKNTGNLMFTQAMFRQLAADVDPIGFSPDPAEVNRRYDVVVVPAANWLNPSADWDWLAEIVRRIDIPVVTIGIGVQAPSRDRQAVAVSASALRFVRLLAGKAELMSARGDFTRDWLRSVGIDNVVTTGCPSLYMVLGSDGRAETPQGIVLQSTRYRMSDGFLDGAGANRDLFELAGRLDLDMIFQSEIEEIDYLVYGSKARTVDEAGAARLAALYAKPDRASLERYLDAHGRVFFDIDDWAKFIRTKTGLIGTRVHGAILALNSGVPAVLIAHDSRTAELIDFAGIPTLAPGTDLRGLAESDLEAIVGDADVELYRRKRADNAARYTDFLTANGLVPSF